MKALVGFAGFGGVDIALRDYGFDVTGFEIDDAIAEVNRANGGHCVTADLLDIAPKKYEGWSLFHFSPPCPNFSVAKVNAAETKDDLSLAHKICEFIKVGRPEIFTLENVCMYRNSLSWLLIWYTLMEEGYGVDAWNLNAADYGVPQSRRRMIVIARRDGRQPAKPFPTHSATPDFFTKPHRGWYQAIADLIPDLPETELAPWQADRMPDDVIKTTLIGHSSTIVGLFDAKEPSFTVTTSSSRGRAVILHRGQYSTPKPHDEPCNTITADGNQTGIKAFIVGGQYQTPNNGQSRIVQNKAADSPDRTICGSDKLDTKICTSGKFVSMTPRTLARFQDFPDWFVLPANRRLACRGIGNAVPPGLYRAVLKSLGFKNDQTKKRTLYKTQRSHQSV